MPRKEIIRTNITSPEGVNKTVILAKMDTARVCKFCNSAPMVKVQNVAEKTDVARMFNYTVHCPACKLGITGTDIDNVISRWNFKYGLDPAKATKSSDWASTHQPLNKEKEKETKDDYFN